MRSTRWCGWPVWCTPTSAKQPGGGFDLTASRRRVRAVGLAEQVVAVCCEQDVVSTKPYPDLYQLACRRLGVEPADAVAVEDSARFCVAVPNPVTAGQDLADAHLRAGSLAGLGHSALVAAHGRWRAGLAAAPHRLSPGPAAGVRVHDRSG